MTGYRFTLAMAEANSGALVTEMVELDGIPGIGHRLRVRLDSGEADLWITDITWFHSPGALSPSGQLSLSGHLP